MYKARFSLILIVLLALVMSTAAQVEPFTVTPPSGPRQTNHSVVGAGLTPDQIYLFEVVYRETGETVFAVDVQADSDGTIQIDLLTEASDDLGIYDVNLYDGDTLARTGTITITATTAPSAGSTSLSYNQTVDGMLDMSRAEDQYTFEGEQGDIVSITLRSADFDTFLSLYGPDGLQLRFNDNGIPPTDSAIFAYTLPATGTYTLGAGSRDAAETGGSSRVSGAYVLSLSVARPSQEGEIAAGETIVGELSLVAQRAQYAFEGRAGEIVTIDLRSEAFDSIVRLFTTDGTQVAQDDDSGGGLNARIARFRLPADGQFIIVVDGFRGFTGERRLQGQFTVTLDIEGRSSTTVAQATPAPATPTPLPSIAGSVGAVDFGETTVGELTGQAQTGRFTFIGAAGDVVTIALDSNAFDPKVALVAPDGTTLAEDDDSGPNLNALISDYTLPTDGEYTIVVDGFRGAAGDRTLLGQFSLMLNRAGDAPTQQPSATPDPAQPTTAPTAAAPEARSGAIAPGQPVAGEFTESSQGTAYTFEASAGDTVTIDLRSDELDPIVRLLGPDGALVAEDDDSGGGVQARLSDVVLPANGTYTIEVDAFRGIDSTRVVLGSFELSLELTASPDVETQATTVPDATTPPDATATPDAATPEATSTPDMTVTPLAQGGDGDIAPGDSVEIAFTGATDESHEFRFNGAAGDVVSFIVTSDGTIDTRLELIAEDGLAVAEDDDSGSGFDPELLGVTLPAYGSYRIIVQPVVEGAAGTVVFTYRSYTETALGDGAVRVTLNDKFGPQVLRFTGRAGETVRLVIISTSQVGGAPEIVVTQGDVALASQVIGRNLRLTFEFVTPSDGRVDVKVLREAGAYGELEISIERLAEE